MFEAGASTAEISEKLHMSDNGVYQHKRRLVARGFLPASQRGQRASGTGSPRRLPSEATFHRMTEDAAKGIEQIDAENAQIEQRKEQLQADIASLNDRQSELAAKRRVFEAVRDTITSDADAG